MTDKELIELLRKINKYCGTRSCTCEDCNYHVDGHCQVRELEWQLDGEPVCWDIEAIERIINE